MTLDRLEDRAAIADQMFRYARATDWLETDGHRDVFVADCVFASPHSGDVLGVDAVVEWMDQALAPFEATQHLIGNISDRVHRPGLGHRGELRAGLAPLPRPRSPGHGAVG